MTHATVGTRNWNLHAKYFIIEKKRFPQDNNEFPYDNQLKLLPFMLSNN